MTGFDPRSTPWNIDESEFWELDGPRAQREFLLRYAVLAPSGHNTQPWTFNITAAGIEVDADYSRRLPIADPQDRELLISIGAAIFNLRVAAAHFGFDTTVSYGAAPLALVTLRETCNPSESLRKLFPAIPRRHTSRTAFEHREIAPEILDTVCETVESANGVHFIVPHDRTRIAELIENADRLLMSDEQWRAELAQWVRPNESAEGDGMSADAFGIPGPVSALAPYLVRTVDAGTIRGKQDRAFAEHATGLIAITSTDATASLLRAGEALENVLLTLTSLGIQYAFLNQICQVPALRRELWDLIRTPHPPQLLLRIGYGREVKTKPMPRRPVALALSK